MSRNIVCATAKIHGSFDYPQLHGTVNFRQMRSGVLVTAQIFNLPDHQTDKPNIFAFHIHDGDSCQENNAEPFPNAGSHYNPHNLPHPCHAGDLPPLFGNHGYAYMSVFTDRFSLKDIIGKIVIIHSDPDDFTSQPSGNAGSKIACGKILTG